MPVLKLKPAGVMIVYFATSFSSLGRATDVLVLTSSRVVVRSRDGFCARGHPARRRHPSRRVVRLSLPGGHLVSLVPGPVGTSLRTFSETVPHSEESLKARFSSILEVRTFPVQPSSSFRFRSGRQLAEAAHRGGRRTALPPAACNLCSR